MNEKSFSKKIEIIFFITIFFIGIFFRLWKLDNLPNGLDGDVITTATNSLHLFKGAVFKVFQNNTLIGHPVAYLYWSMPLGSFLIALFMNLFKQIELGILFSSAFAGILTIPVVYILAKKLSNIPTALITTYLFAVSPIHLVFSRSGFTHIVIIVGLISIALYFLYIAVDTQNKKFLYYCGIFWGFILFNSYPIAYVVAPITILYMIWTGKWKWIISKEFLCAGLISIFLFLILSLGFALLNGYSDLLIVFKESYYQWIRVRLNETISNSNVIKNIYEGLQMLFINTKPTYEFGILRIFNYPILDRIVGFTFIVGLIISIIRRNNTDKLLILWSFLTFLITSVINIPQERYLLTLLPVPYIYCSAVVTSLYNFGSNQRLKSTRIYTSILLFFLLVSYGYFVGYHRYFVSYAANNANILNGLGDADVAEFLTKNVNPGNSIIISSIQLPGVDLYTNFKYKNLLIWPDFIKKLSNISTKNEELFSSNIENIILVLSLNPNFKYFGNYDDAARAMRSQAKIVFGIDIDKNVIKKIFDSQGRIIFEIYSLKSDDIRI